MDSLLQGANDFAVHLAGTGWVYWAVLAFAAVDALIPKLGAKDFDLDEKQRAVSLTESGNERMEQMLHEAGHLMPISCTCCYRYLQGTRYRR